MNSLATGCSCLKITLLPPTTKLGQGNVLQASVILSTGEYLVQGTRGGCLLPGGLLLGGSAPGGVCSQGGGCLLLGGGACSGGGVPGGDPPGTATAAAGMHSCSSGAHSAKLQISKYVSSKEWFQRQ